MKKRNQHKLLKEPVKKMTLKWNHHLTNQKITPNVKTKKKMQAKVALVLVLAMAAAVSAQYYGGCYETDHYCTDSTSCNAVAQDWVDLSIGATNTEDTTATWLNYAFPYCPESHCLAYDSSAELKCVGYNANSGDFEYIEPYTSLTGTGGCREDNVYIQSINGFCNKYARYALRKSQFFYAQSVLIA